MSSTFLIFIKIKANLNVFYIITLSFLRTVVNIENGLILVNLSQIGFAFS